MHLFYVRVEGNTSLGNMAVRTNAAATILVSTEEYVRRFVTLTAEGLTAAAPTRTLVGDVTR